MSEPSETVVSTRPRPARRPWQWGLRSALLMTAAVAVWTAVYANRREVAVLESRIAVMRPLARELVVADPAQFAAVKRDSLWTDDDRWDVYVPPGRYRIALATHAIADTGLAPALKTAPIAPGRHSLTLGQTQNLKTRSIVMAIDGAALFEVAEPTGWSTFPSSMGGGQHERSTQSPVEEPFVLYRRRYLPANMSSFSSASLEPCEGALLWIEREDQPSGRRDGGSAGAPESP